MESLRLEKDAWIVEELGRLSPGDLMQVPVRSCVVCLYLA